MVSIAGPSDSSVSYENQSAKLHLHMQIRKYLRRLMMGLSPGRSKGSIKDWSVVEPKGPNEGNIIAQNRKAACWLDLCDRAEKVLH
jgi:hypothetical protein